MTHERGATVLEVVIALSVVIVLVTAALGGERAQRRAIAAAYSDPGGVARGVEPDRDAGLGGRVVDDRQQRASRRRWRARSARSAYASSSPASYEIEVEVVHPDDDVRAVLTTRLARELAP